MNRNRLASELVQIAKSLMAAKEIEFDGKNVNDVKNFLTKHGYKLNVESNGKLTVGKNEHVIFKDDTLLIKNGKLLIKKPSYGGGRETVVASKLLKLSKELMASTKLYKSCRMSLDTEQDDGDIFISYELTFTGTWPSYKDVVKGYNELLSIINKYNRNLESDFKEENLKMKVDDEILFYTEGKHIMIIAPYWGKLHSIPFSDQDDIDSYKSELKQDFDYVDIDVD